MPWLIRSSAVLPFTLVRSTCSAAATAASAAAARTSATACCFGLGDLRLGHLGAAGDEFLDLGLGFGGDTLGVGARAGDDAFGFLLGVAAAALGFGEHCLRLFLQPACLVELGLDAVGAVVERLR